jgi:SAM-dependent methyltransferase
VKCKARSRQIADARGYFNALPPRTVSLEAGRDNRELEIHALHAGEIPNMDEAIAVTVDQELDQDTDSGYAEDFESISTSLASSAAEYRFEFGRRYHAYHHGQHFLPNDQQEQDRMDLTHYEMMLLLEDRLYLAPINNPQRVLDLGTGTGIWAIDFAEVHPESLVIGNDLSPIQPDYIPANVQFVVDDIEDDWTYENNPFDFVHARYLAGSIRDWPRLMRQAFNCTAPGGWVEFQDWDCMVESHDDSIPKDSPFYVWHTAVLGRIEATNTGRPGPRLEQWVRDAGFVNVGVQKFAIPHNIWPRDPRLKKIGALNLSQWEHGLEGISVGCLSRSVSDEAAWSIQDIRNLMDQAKASARTRTFHGQYTL